MEILRQIEEQPERIQNIHKIKPSPTVSLSKPKENRKTDATEASIVTYNPGDVADASIATCNPGDTRPLEYDMYSRVPLSETAHWTQDDILDAIERNLGFS